MIIELPGAVENHFRCLAACCHAAREQAGSFVIDYTKEQLKAAPAGSIDELTRDDGLAYRDRVFEYYKVTTAPPPRHS